MDLFKSSPACSKRSNRASCLASISTFSMAAGRLMGGGSMARHSSSVGTWMPAASTSCTSCRNAASSKSRPGETSSSSFMYSPRTSGKRCTSRQRRFISACSAGAASFNNCRANSRSRYFRASSNVNPWGCIVFIGRGHSTPLPPALQAKCGAFSPACRGRAFG